MIVVKVEMWPHGNEQTKRDLACLCIANIGGDHELGNYQYWMSHQIDSPYGKDWPGYAEFARGGATPCVWKHGVLNQFPRRLGVMKLLARVLRAALPRG